ncbi:Uncharacterised protein [Mycobacteroides abscessus subsp. abscessus]|nr:Uncharacterised protein [Mycobacteroides abscessus subsp. abscessus]
MESFFLNILYTAVWYVNSSPDDQPVTLEEQLDILPLDAWQTCQQDDLCFCFVYIH